MIQDNKSYHLALCLPPKCTATPAKLDHTGTDSSLHPCRAPTLPTGPLPSSVPSLGFLLLFLLVGLEFGDFFFSDMVFL